MKKLSIILIVIILFSGFNVFAADDNLIENGSFNTHEYWDVYSTSKNEDAIGAVKLDNKNYMQIKHTEPEYSSFEQYISAEEGTNYKVSFDLFIDSENVDDFVIFFGDCKFYPSVFGTVNQVSNHVEFYIISEYKTAASLRFDYGSQYSVSGTVRVSDVCVYETADIPTDAVYQNFTDYSENNSDYQENAEQNQNTSEAEETDNTVQSLIDKDFDKTITISIIIMLIFLTALLLMLFKHNIFTFGKWNVLIIICAFALLKIATAAMVYGHYYDMSCFASWANGVNEYGISGFYESGMFCDYPPGYLYILYILSIFTKGTVFLSPINGLLLKLPAILAELGIAYFAYKLAKKKFSENISLFISILILANPLFLTDVSLWGQIDPILCLCMVASIYFMMEDKKLLAAFIFALGLLIKPQMLILAPVFVLPYFQEIFNKKTWRNGIGKFLLSLIIGAAALILFTLPFKGNQPFFWFLDKYFGTVSQYPYATMNAFNFFGMIGKNYAADTDPFLFLDYRTWGIIFIVITVAVCIFLYFWKKDKSQLFLISALIFAGVFMLGPRMHERYIVPAIYFLIFAFIYAKDYRILFSYIALSITGALNLIVILLSKEYFADDKLIIFCSVLSVLAFGYFIYSLIMLCVKKKPKVVIEAAEDNKIEKFNQDPKNTKLNRKDSIIILAVTLIYAVVAFVNLGSTSVPQTGAQVKAGDKIEVEFEDPVDIETLKFYSGLGKADFKIGDETFIKDTAEMWKWQYRDLELYEVSKLEIEITSGELNIFELAFANGSGEEYNIPKLAFMDIGESDKFSNNLKIKEIKLNGVSTKELLDEQQFVPGENSSYLYDMYFDEVYHARTAYEHINNIWPYEITHPPLGKIIMTIGIDIFGMNPFGWRFMGTLFGVLMLPVMYIFAKKLFGSTTFASFATMLFAVDFMHFAQTRIATIDSYSIFFIMLMYLFMYLYVKANNEGQSIKKALVYLALSGLFFGLGAATKWICIYAGIGLAAIFFYQLIKSKQYIILKLSVAFATFVALTAIIYIASYTPYLLAKGEPYTLGRLLEIVWDNQKYMLNYHGNLTVETPHPFASRWYTWPLTIRPMFFYMGVNLPENMISGISSFGNPLIWWGGLVCIAGIGILKIKGKSLNTGFILTAIGSQFLPWIFISRETYIYHYFASVPFLILLTAYFLKYFYDKYKWGKKLTYTYLGVAVALFIMFYPVLSGTYINKDLSDVVLRWLSTWPFY